MPQFLWRPPENQGPKVELPSDPDSWEAKVLNFASGVLNSTGIDEQTWEKGGKWGAALAALAPFSTFITDNPLKAFHGTKAAFDYFNPRKFGHPHQPGSKWIHMGRDPQTAGTVAMESRPAIGNAAPRGYTDEGLNVIPVELPKNKVVYEKAERGEPGYEIDTMKSIHGTLEKRLKAIDRLIDYKTRKGAPPEELQRLAGERKAIDYQKWTAKNYADSGRMMDGMSVTSTFDPRVVQKTGIHAVQYQDPAGPAIAFPPEQRLRTPWGTDVTRKNIEPRTMRAGGNVPKPKPFGNKPVTKIKVNVKEPTVDSPKTGLTTKDAEYWDQNPNATWWHDELVDATSADPFEDTQKLLDNYKAFLDNGYDPEHAISFVMAENPHKTFAWTPEAEMKFQNWSSGNMIDLEGPGVSKKPSVALPPKKGVGASDVDWQESDAEGWFHPTEKKANFDVNGLDAPKMSSGMNHDQAWDMLEYAIKKISGKSEQEKEWATHMAKLYYDQAKKEGLDPLETAHKVNSNLFQGELPLVGMDQLGPTYQRALGKVKTQFESHDPTPEFTYTWGDPYHANKTGQQRYDFLKPFWKY